VARTADDAGFEYIAVMDHFFQIPVIGPPEMEMLEGYTTLGYLAACTSRAALLTVITGTVYRHPGVLAKIITTLDVLSKGRCGRREFCDQSKLGSFGINLFLMRAEELAGPAAIKRKNVN